MNNIIDDGIIKNDIETIFGFSRAQSIVFLTCLIFAIIVLGCLFYRLCSITFSKVLKNVKSLASEKRLSSSEKKVKMILSDERAREILKARAITAINSKANSADSAELGIDENSNHSNETERVTKVTFSDAVIYEEERNDN